MSATDREPSPPGVAEPPASSGPAPLADRLDAVRRGARERRLHPVAARVDALTALRSLLADHERAFVDALRRDLGKSDIEALLTEVDLVASEIDHALDRIETWTRPRRYGLPLRLRPGRARARPEPLGTVLIIAPWNYPLQLTLAPLVAALAAGNTVVLKPSELAPATAGALAALLPRALGPELVQVVEGDAEVGAALLAERFDHIFFTGSRRVGQEVLRAAAEHVTPVTLELGGKSPAIVTPSADPTVSARRIAWGKFVNAGQTCIAPDYVLVQRSHHDELVAGLVAAVESFFGADPSTSPDFGRIVSDRHLDRLRGFLTAGGYDAIACGGVVDPDERYVAPTVLTGVSDDAPVMSDEIFGPILPVLVYDTIDDAIAFVNARPAPLALYPFGHDEHVDRIIDRTVSGGVTVNHTLLHVSVPDLPFGGVGDSGMGAYHGEAGFRTFSHHRPVYRRPLRPDPTLLYPPYSRLAAAILRRLG